MVKSGRNSIQCYSIHEAPHQKRSTFKFATGRGNALSETMYKESLNFIVDDANTTYLQVTNDAPNIREKKNN
jgi:hypothetical protein